MISPRELAHAAFWTDHPLTQLYAWANGRWVGRTYQPATTWSIKQLIAFAEAQPATVIDNLARPS